MKKALILNAYFFHTNCLSEFDSSSLLQQWLWNIINSYSMYMQAYLVFQKSHISTPNV